MRAIAIEEFGFVSGGADADVKMQSEGASVFCPDYACALVQSSGSAAAGLSPSGWDTLVGTVAGAGATFVGTEIAGGFAVGMGLVAAPTLLVGGVVLGAAVLGVAVSYGLASYMKDQADAALQRTSRGCLTAEP